MTLCPVAIAVGCKKCPVFKVCPAKSTLGDYQPPSEQARTGSSKEKSATKSK